MKLLPALIVVALQTMLVPLASTAQIPPPPARTDPSGIESVLVTGEQPGPSLWEVTDGEHSLWVLASYAPLPKDMAWRSREVEAVIAQSQVVLGPYSASFAVDDADVLRTKRAKLRQLLPRKAYARWRALRREYIAPGVETENLLPASAAMLLRVSALEVSGLVYTDDLWRTIYRLANRYQVPVDSRHQLTIPVGAQSSTKRAERSRIGVDYLIETMERLDEDLLAARERANAWAVGDIERMREQANTDREYAYLNAYSWPFLQGQALQDALALVDKKWVDAAHAALQRNENTFAVLPSYLVFQEAGPLAALKARGYVVLPPQEEP